MNELKPVETTLRILQKVNEENTGSRSDFAEYLGLSPNHLTKYIRKIEAVLQAEIGYSRKRCTYYLAKVNNNIIPSPLFKMILNIAKSVRGCVAIANRLIFERVKPNLPNCLNST